MPNRFISEELFLTYKLAKDNGFQCFAFQKDKKIEQFFIVKHDRIGTVYDCFGGVSYCTVHKPNIKCGTGFSLGGYLSSKKANIDMLYEAINTVCPDWYRNEVTPKKFKNWDEYIKRNRILEYFEI